MVQDKNKDAFAARLARLDGDRSNTGPKKNAAKPEKKGRPKKRGELSFARRIQLWGFAFIFVVVGGAYLYNSNAEFIKRLIPETKGMGVQIATALGLNGPVKLGTNQPFVPSGQKDPNSDIQRMDTGNKTHSPTVLSGENVEVLITDLFTDYQQGADSKIPANITQFDTLTSCEPRAPNDSEKIVGARLGQLGQAAHIQVFDRTRMRDVLMKNLGNTLTKQRKIRVSGVGKYNPENDKWNYVNGQMKPIDVILTDTSKPLYLVLQSGNSQILWNLHLAAGVQLSHVVMISNGKIAISGLPANTSYEALKIGDFVTNHEFGADDVFRECMIRPWRKPQQDWKAWQKAERDKGDKFYGSGIKSLHQNMIHSFTQGYNAYNQWYTGAFGYDAGLNTVAGQSASHVLLGPVPAKELPYHSIGDNDLLVSRSDYVFKGDAQVRLEQVSKLHNDLLQAAMGTDRGLLWPNATSGDIK